MTRRSIIYKIVEKNYLKSHSCFVVLCFCLSKGALRPLFYSTQYWRKLLVKIPIKLQTNVRAHWKKSWSISNDHKKIVYAFLKKSFGLKSLSVPCKIVLTRVGKRVVDFDNLVYSFKTIRDSVADFIFPGYQPGQADGKSDLVFEYQQRVGPEYLIEIEFTELL